MIFTTQAIDVARISSVVEKAIESEYGFPVTVLLHDADQVRYVRGRNDVLSRHDHEGAPHARHERY
ncbi:MAG: hypothetical protein ACYC6C_08755 [Coriobacteriia bacterium]